MITDFHKQWTEKFQGCSPIGYRLRTCFPDEWFRIHTLPGSKRYADSPSEKAEILTRHNAIISELLGVGGRYILLTTQYSGDQLPVKESIRHEVTGLEMEYAFSAPTDDIEDDEEPYYWHFFIAKDNWKPDSVNDLLDRIADDEIWDVSFLDERLETIYHPYDGGGDFFIFDADRIEKMRSRFSSWLSTHPYGL